MEEKVIEVYKSNPTIESAAKLLVDLKGTKIITREIQVGIRTERVTQKVKRKKDIRECIKFYKDTNATKKLLDLSQTAQKTLFYLMSEIDRTSTCVYIISSKFCRELELSRQSLSAGIKELVEHKWIYKSTTPKMYWINLHFVCKGNIEDIYYKWLDNKEI